MGAGLTLNLLPVNAYLACLIIALTTAMLSVLGAYIGRKSGTWLGSWAEALGGLVLIAIGSEYGGLKTVLYLGVTATN